MNHRIRIGIFFGGRSREREVSFAGGRTVYDNLDKSLFTPVPIFVDSFNRFILLDWSYIYKGSIRDFYPPVSYYPKDLGAYQIYADSLDPSKTDTEAMASEVGQIIPPHELPQYMDFAFLALHGSYGEDGSLQGLLEWLDIPYSGSGVLGTAIGVNKRIQKTLTQQTHLPFTPLSGKTIRREDWNKPDFHKSDCMHSCMEELGLPLVIKSANQGSSIGVQFLTKPDIDSFISAVDTCFFEEQLSGMIWKNMSSDQKHSYIRRLIDYREGPGLPVFVNHQLFYLPQPLMEFLDAEAEKEGVSFRFTAVEGESEVLIEPMIKGREFSCIVIKDDQGKAVALPPTEIIKKQDFFDYRSKYLPGISRKETPMNVPDQVLHLIRNACEQMCMYFDFKVYARIDGFWDEQQATLYLNDPNTTSGMMPSSFFFHQAAEVGMSPSVFITYIIRTSLQERIRSRGLIYRMQELLHQLDLLLSNAKHQTESKERIAVVLGGNSFERHISVESGRNIFEKLNASPHYIATPVFLDYQHQQMRFYALPIHILLKDNADDIRDKVMNHQPHPPMEYIRGLFSEWLQRYTLHPPVFTPVPLTEKELGERFDGVFIALHGRPGEDGSLQLVLEQQGLYYNGSRSESSAITIDKYKTIQCLRQHGMPVTEQQLIHREEWNTAPQPIIENLKDTLGFPMIVKPHDDGCSAAVVKIKNEEQLKAYAQLIFRMTGDELQWRSILGVSPSDEFPHKEVFLAEQLIHSSGAVRFLEITGGMLTTYRNGNVEYQIFEPSETLAEGEILSLEEKFLAGEGQNITPARYATDPDEQRLISEQVKQALLKVAQILQIEGYCRIDAFVRIFEGAKAEVIVIEVNSLPGMTPATCIYHQAALQSLKPDEFIEQILQFGKQRLLLSTATS